MLVRSPTPTPKEADLRRIYDAVIVGSGAGGGMAAHVLTSHGLDVLLLEAGKKLPIEDELKSMEWPYDHPRRGDKPYSAHALSFNEYTIRQPPYAKGLRTPLFRLPGACRHTPSIRRRGPRRDRLGG